MITLDISEADYELLLTALLALQSADQNAMLALDATSPAGVREAYEARARAAVSLSGKVRAFKYAQQ